MTIFRQRPQLGSGGNSEDMHTLRSHAFGAKTLLMTRPSLAHGASRFTATRERETRNGIIYLTVRMEKCKCRCPL